MGFGKKRRARASGDSRLLPGSTPRSLVASVLCMLLACSYTQYSILIVADNIQSP